jgi:ribosomal protein S18 acetylase RimI-like enzyme
MSQRSLEARDAVARAKQPDAAFIAGVRFRRAVPADVPAVTAVINDAYLREAWLLPPPRITEQGLAEEMRDPEVELLIAEFGGEIAGCVRFRHREQDTHFGMLAVAPSHQGHGLASLLVGQVEDGARAAGSPAVRLDCAKENNLVPLYESMGYRLEREAPNSYYGHKGPITVSYMVKHLNGAGRD